jgi:hypothetical protein
MNGRADKVSAKGLPPAQRKEGPGTPVPGPSTIVLPPWSWSPTVVVGGYRSGMFDLCHKGSTVAQVLWLRTGGWETVGMTRIVDSLNRPRDTHFPSLRPVWWATGITRRQGHQPDEFALSVGDGPAAISVLWLVVPSEHRMAVVMRRVLDGLDQDRGLPAVFVPPADTVTTLAPPTEPDVVPAYELVES